MTEVEQSKPATSRDISAPRHFGTTAEMSETLRHQTVLGPKCPCIRLITSCSVQHRNGTIVYGVTCTKRLKAFSFVFHASCSAADGTAGYIHRKCPDLCTSTGPSASDEKKVGMNRTFLFILRVTNRDTGRSRDRDVESTQLRISVITSD